MIIDTEHLRSVTERNLHIVRWPNEGDALESAVREAARAQDHHLAFLDGRTLTTKREVLLALDDALDFPRPASGAEPNWNSAADWTGDLGWLLRQGVVLLLREPEHLMRANLLEFAFLVDTLGIRSQSVSRRGQPFHVVVGPMPEDYAYEAFMNLLSVSRHFCEACQMVDGDRDPDQDAPPSSER